MFRKILPLFSLIVLGYSFQYKDEFWWDTSVFYGIYPQSFKDTNGDGIGDLKGIIEKLSYIKNLGVDAIFLNPFYKSHEKMYVYDIEDFKAVDPLFGSIEDFEKLVAECRKLGLRLVIKMILDRTSKEHAWFQNSIKKIDPYTDYYIWKNASEFLTDGTPSLPESGCNGFWNWNEDRHQFVCLSYSEEPILNLSIENVWNEMKEVVLFWLRKNIDGIGLEGLEMSGHVYDTFLDKKVKSLNSSQDTTSDNCSLFEGKYNITCKALQIIRGWFSESSSNMKDQRKLILVEGNEETKNSSLYYQSGADIVLSDVFESWDSTAIAIRNLIESFNLSTTNWPQRTFSMNWMIKTSNNRLFTFGQETIIVIYMMIHLLPGNTYFHYGDELGMTDYNYFDKDTYVNSKMLPFQWSSRFQAGFSESNTTFLPVNTNFYRLNAEDEEKDPKSSLHFFKTLFYIRKHPAFKTGEMQTIEISNNVTAFVRYSPQFQDEKFVFLANAGRSFECIRMQDYYPELPLNAYILLATPNSEHGRGDKWNRESCLSLRPWSALLLGTTATAVSNLTRIS